MAGVQLEFQQRYGRRRRARPMSDINVTPMVDVMLVLLVIFMVTAPLLTVGVQVDLPETSAAPVVGQDEPLAVSIDAGGQIFLQKSAVSLEELPPRLAAMSGANPDLRIFVRGDKAIDYGRVMTVVGAINAAGFRKVALVTEVAGATQGTAAGGEGAVGRDGGRVEKTP